MFDIPKVCSYYLVILNLKTLQTIQILFCHLSSLNSLQLSRSRNRKNLCNFKLRIHCASWLTFASINNFLSSSIRSEQADVIFNTWTVFIATFVINNFMGKIWLKARSDALFRLSKINPVPLLECKVERDGWRFLQKLFFFAFFASTYQFLYCFVLYYSDYIRCIII